MDNLLIYTTQCCNNYTTLTADRASLTKHGASCGTFMIGNTKFALGCCLEKLLTVSSRHLDNKGQQATDWLRRKVAMLIVALCIMTVFGSCEHKELCYLHPHQTRVKVRIDVDWSLYDGELPEGMTVAIYPINGQAPEAVLTNDITHVSLYLNPGEYHLGVISYSVNEFSTIQFRNVYNYETICISPFSMTSDWYTPDQGETLSVEPEDFGTDAQYNIIVPEATSLPLDYGEVLIATLYPENILTTIDVVVNVSGAKYFKSARASLSNLAQDFLLGTLSAGNTKTSHVLDTWTATDDPDDASRGSLLSSIKTLGLPSDFDYQPNFNTLKLQISLVDNKTTLNYEIPVGHRFEQIAKRHWRVVVGDEILLPEVEQSSTSSGNSSGFDVDIDPWPDDENADFDI